MQIKKWKIYQLKLNKYLKKLTKKFTWVKKKLKFESYYRDLHLIFVELNYIWYYQNTSYFIKYNKLLKSNPVPNDQILGELLSNFLKNIAHADNNVMTTEELYQKMNNERKKLL